MLHWCSEYYSFYSSVFQFLKIITSKNKTKNPPKTPVQMSLSALRPQAGSEEKESMGFALGCLLALLRETLLQKDILHGNAIIISYYMFAYTKLFVLYFMGYFRDFGKLLWPHLTFACYDAIRTEPEVTDLIGVWPPKARVVFVCTFQAMATQDALWFSAHVIQSGAVG